MAISTHVLDTSRGRPAVGVAVTLEQWQDGAWRPAGRGTTDADGRARDLWSGVAPPPAGTYRLGFETGAYFAALGVDAFHPRIDVTFAIRDAGEHHHVPVLLAPFAFSTYRGS